MEVKGEGKKQKTADARVREACPFFASRCNIFDSGWQAYFKGKEIIFGFGLFCFVVTIYFYIFAKTSW